MLLRAAVNQWHYDVVEAADGEEAWNILQKSDAPRLLIIDWIMPKIDGIDLCKRIRGELRAHHYIILLTQVVGTANLIKGLEAGADEFLSKPFNMAELCSRLSVGSRLLSYENKMTAQSKQTNTYVSQLIKLSAHLQALARSINEIVNSNQIHDEKKIDDLIKQTEELKAELDKNAKVIQKLHDIVKA
jgi:DNA-binding response OmpR family regulator